MKSSLNKNDKEPKNSANLAMFLGITGGIISIGGVIFGGFQEFASLKASVSELKVEQRFVIDQLSRTEKKIDIFLQELNMERVDIAGLRGQVDILKNK